jgi:Fe-S cluster biogenesis protein NfuA
MEEPHPEWEDLSHDEKLALIRSVVEAEITPQLAYDGGGVDIVDLVHEKEVSIAYRGTCASCPMALYGTLGFIQQVLSTKVHSSLVVTPMLQ